MDHIIINCNMDFNAYFKNEDFIFILLDFKNHNSILIIVQLFVMYCSSFDLKLDKILGLPTPG